jgi:hypothetical protein
MSPSVTPPKAAKASVSATWRTIAVRRVDDGADKMDGFRGTADATRAAAPAAHQCRARALSSNVGWLNLPSK